MSMIHEGMREAFPKKTNEELADALEKHAGRSSFQPYRTFERDDLREAAQKLRDMPEGERKEGWASKMLSRNSKGTPDHEWHVFDLTQTVFSERPATLILHTRKEGESK